MKVPRSLTAVIESFERLPGIGPKSAQRLAYYLLHVPQSQLDAFADAVMNLKKNTVKCEVCMNIGERSPCEICDDRERKGEVICIVEQPLDLVAIENSGKFDGVYHVLHGVLDPLNHIGPDELFLEEFFVRLAEVEEVILGLNPTMEGEATGLYIKDQMSKRGFGARVSRLAQGLPLGGDVEYADAVTLGRALEGRTSY